MIIFTELVEKKVKRIEWNKFRFRSQLENLNNKLRANINTNQH